MTLPILQAAGFKLNPVYVDIIAKNATKLTDGQISALAANADFSFAVMVAKCQHDSGLTISELMRSTDANVAAAISGYIKAIGYPKVRKTWPSGGYTPSRDDMCNRAAQLYVTLRSQLIKYS